MKKTEFKKLVQNNIEYVILIVVSLILSIPLFRSGFLSTHDGHFHIARIFATIAGIKDGQFLPEIIMEWGNGFGYSWNLFYPPLVTYVGALLKLIMPSYTIVMKAILILLTVMTSISMYKLMMEITEKKSISLLTAIIYVSVPNRLSNIYIRLAIGEVITYAFLPILFQGLYNMFKKDGEKDYLIVIGTAGIALSHNISTLIVGIIVIIYVLINITKLKDKKVLKKLLIDGIFLIAIVSFFYGPLLESKLSADYAAFEEGFMMTKKGLAERVLKIKDIFVSSFEIGKLYEKPVVDGGISEVNFMIGLQIIIPLLLVPLALIKQKGNMDKHYLYFLIGGIVIIIISTGIFPWEYVPDIFTMIQGPWRLLMPATILLSIACGMTINYAYKDIKITYIIMAIILILIYSVAYFENLLYVEAYNENIILNPNFSFGNCANFEYFPTKARENMEYIQNREDRAIVTEGEALIVREYKNGTFMEFEIKQNNSENLKIELPYIYYIGYKATINDEKLELTESENGFLEINLENQTGTVNISYPGTIIMNITKIISIIGAMVFIIYCFKEQNDI